MAPSSKTLSFENSGSAESRGGKLKKMPLLAPVPGGSRGLWDRDPIPAKSYWLFFVEFLLVAVYCFMNEYNYLLLLYFKNNVASFPNLSTSIKRLQKILLFKQN